MSAPEEEPKPEPEEPQEPEEAGEPGGMSDRTAKVILLVIAAGAVWGIVAAFPWIAYVIVGVMLTLGWQKARSWLARRRQEPANEPMGEALLMEAEVVQALHSLAAPNVFLSVLAAELCLTMEATRAALEELGIKVRRAVRVGDTTGVGVHKDDIPPLPRPSSEDPVEPVDLQQQHNQQANVRVERTDGGLIIYDLSDGARHHRVQ